MALGFGTSLCSPKSPCPCGSSLVYGSCCGPLHWATTRAETAEQLMRSRYTAFVLGDVDYLIATHLDPEAPSRGGATEINTYPLQKIYNMGINIQF